MIICQKYPFSVSLISNRSPSVSTLSLPLITGWVRILSYCSFKPRVQQLCSLLDQTWKSEMISVPSTDYWWILCPGFWIKCINSFHIHKFCCKILTLFLGTNAQNDSLNNTDAEKNIQKTSSEEPERRCRLLVTSTERCSPKTRPTVSMLALPVPRLRVCWCVSS